MRTILCFFIMLVNLTNSFNNIIKISPINRFNKKLTKLYNEQNIYEQFKNKLEIYPFSTIIYYKLTDIQRDSIKQMIDDRFEMVETNIQVEPAYYLGLTLYKQKNVTHVDSYCKIFIYVKDKLLETYGQYILETTLYENGLHIDDNNLMCSFYSNNINYSAYVSYYQYYYDARYYTSYNYFDFIYENKQSYINTHRQSTNIIFFPEYHYMTQLKYKDMYWKKAEQIIYFKNSFNYELK